MAENKWKPSEVTVRPKPEIRKPSIVSGDSCFISAERLSGFCVLLAHQRALPLPDCTEDNVKEKREKDSFPNMKMTLKLKPAKNPNPCLSISEEGLSVPYQYVFWFGKWTLILNWWIINLSGWRPESGLLGSLSGSVLICHVVAWAPRTPFEVNRCSGSLQIKS